MDALLLPGNSPRHAAWVQELKQALAPHFDRVEAQQYKHWQTAVGNTDVDYEIGVAQQTAERLNQYMVIAKSIGTVIAIKATANKNLQPEKLILLGVPLYGGMPKDLFGAWLQHITVPIVFVQNTHDPLGSFSDVKSAFENTGSHVSFIELPGDTHSYVDFNAITKLI